MIISASLDKYIRLVGGLAGRNLSIKGSTVTLDSYSYHGLHTVFYFNNRMGLGFDHVNYKMSFKLMDLIKVLTYHTSAHYAAKHLQDVLKYAF